MKTSQKQLNYEFGLQGEKIAEQYLRSKGYEILERRWKTRGIEIDLIAREGCSLVVVEVKARRDKIFTAPEKAVDHKKQQRLVSAADEFVRRHDIKEEVRFDIIAIVANNEEVEVNHIESAFAPLWQ